MCSTVQVYVRPDKWYNYIWCVPCQLLVSESFVWRYFTSFCLDIVSIIERVMLGNLSPGVGRFLKRLKNWVRWLLDWVKQIVKCQYRLIIVGRDCNKHNDGQWSIHIEYIFLLCAVSRDRNTRGETPTFMYFLAKKRITTAHSIQFIDVDSLPDYIMSLNKLTTVVRFN